MNRSRVRKRTVSTLALLLLASILTACSPTEAAPTPAGADLPDSPLAEQTIRCMEDQGFEASLEWDGGISGPAKVSADESGQWGTAIQACAEESGYGNLQALTDEQVIELYAQEVAEYECLRDAGYSPAEPPSQQTYVDTFASADQYYAFQEALDPMGQKDAQEATALCPPPTWFLNLTGA